MHSLTSEDRAGRHISMGHRVCCGCAHQGSCGKGKAVQTSEAGEMDHSSGADLRCAATPLPTVLCSPAGFSPISVPMPRWLCDHFSTHRYVTWKNNSVLGILLFLVVSDSVNHTQWQPKSVSKEFLICHRDRHNTKCFHKTSESFKHQQPVI